MDSRIGDERLADLATQHLRQTWSQLALFRGGEILESEHAVAYATGHPAYAANGCVVSGPIDPRELDAALAWVERRAARYLLTIDDRHGERLGATLARRGLTSEGPAVPGMAIDPESIPATTDDVEVEAVDESNYGAWTAITGAVYSGEEMTRRLWPLELLGRDEISAMVGKVDGRYVSVGTVIRTGSTAGVYAVGTLEHARRRGAGSAVTAGVVAAARAQWGSEFVFLQSSDIAVPVYAALGFGTVVGYRMFGIDTET